VLRRPSTVLAAGRADRGASPAVSYGERERPLQLSRRGRHVEFNLVHDRGTTFGLQTDARIESVLMGLPPRAALDYSPVYAPGSFEAELMAMLEPKDWVGGE
jgi:coproporphyrinogen III oxidase